MSADNWTLCPKCQKGEDDDHVNTLLSEDYEIGILNGEFFVIYSGECQECGFSFKFRHTENVVSVGVCDGCGSLQHPAHHAPKCTRPGYTEYPVE